MQIVTWKCDGCGKMVEDKEKGTLVQAQLVTTGYPVQRKHIDYCLDCANKHGFVREYVPPSQADKLFELVQEMVEESVSNSKG